jgi:hypothetical protein
MFVGENTYKGEKGERFHYFATSIQLWHEPHTCPLRVTETLHSNMIIQHQLEFEKNLQDSQMILSKIRDEIPEFFNWAADLKNQTITIKYDGKLRLFRMPADFIKSGTIELKERTNTLVFTCITAFPNYFIAIFLGVFIVGLVQKYLLGFSFPLLIIILLPLFLYCGNWIYYKRTFKWATSKVIKHVMHMKQPPNKH